MKYLAQLCLGDPCAGGLTSGADPRCGDVVSSGCGIRFKAMIPLSILDLSVVTTGTKPAAALRNSIDLARYADALGFTRYWLAEHHNLASVASPAPDLMIGQIAAVTKNIRVGSGGVMLPNHAPLMVAERFKMLEALFPGRIDLGLGRAPGTDGATAYALRSRLDRREGDDFLERLHELMLWETRGFPPNHPFNQVVAMPDDTPLPPIWLLGSSDYSSELAAQVGMGYAFAHHFASYDAIAAMTNYRAHFKQTGWRETPYAILAVAVVAAETDAEAERLAASMDLNRLLRDRGQYRPLPSIEEAQAYPYTDADRAAIARNRSRLFVGSPSTVMQKLEPMISASQADELMVITAVYDHDARKKSYSLLADAFGLAKKRAA
jgi:luciferase family oxidoreductase group 1